MASVKIRNTVITGLALSSLVLTACSTDDAESTNADATTSAESSAAESSSDAASDGDTITIEDNHGTQEVPKNSKAIAATDNRSFEILEKWGVDLVAAPKQLVPHTVDAYREDDSVADLGMHRKPDLEALVAAQPDLIINGQRFQSHYDDIKQLNPDAALVEFEPRDDEDFAEELRRHALGLGEILGHEDDAQELVDEFDAAIERAKKAYDGESSVMALNVSGGEIGYVAPSLGRVYGPVFDMLDLKPALEVDDASQNHKGDDISVEAIADSNPNWMFVLDRDAAISARLEPGYQAAKDVIEGSDALRNVAAVKDGQIVYAPEDTYTNESIITYTEILNDIADAFEAAKK